MGVSALIDRDPEVREAIEKALATGAPHTRIAKEHGLSRWNVDRFAKRIERNGNGEPPKPPPPPKPEPVELAGGNGGAAPVDADLKLGEKIDRLKTNALEWTYHNLAPRLGISYTNTKKAHRLFLDDRAERDGSAPRKRRILLLSQQNQELQQERRRIALDESNEEHREVTQRIREVTTELERLEIAQAEFEFREEEGKKRSPERQSARLQKAISALDADIEGNLTECRAALDSAQATFGKVRSIVATRATGRQKLNALRSYVQHPHAGDPADTFRAFVEEWIKRGEKQNARL